MVVKDMAKRLGLKNVAVVHGRVEQFGPEVSAGRGGHSCCPTIAAHWHPCLALSGSSGLGHRSGRDRLAPIPRLV